MQTNCCTDSLGLLFGVLKVPQHRAMGKGKGGGRGGQSKGGGKRERGVQAPHILLIPTHTDACSPSRLQPPPLPPPLPLHPEREGEGWSKGGKRECEGWGGGSTRHPPPPCSY